jgi:hypothetical protein
MVHMEPKKPLCASCARWVVYPCTIGKLPTEAWKCENGFTNAPQATECPAYLREIGVEPW